MAKRPERIAKRGVGELRDLHITRVDRVGAGANPDAHIVLFKSTESDITDGDAHTNADGVQDSHPNTSTASRETASDPEDRMSDVNLDDLAPEVRALIDEAAAARDAAIAERDEATAKAAEAEAALAAVGAGDGATDDEVLKSVDPEVRERILKAEQAAAEAEQRIAKMEDDAARATFIAKAREYADIDGDAEGIGEALKDVAKSCQPETAQTIERVLKAATAKIAKGHEVLTASLGATTGPTDTESQIESLAKARAEKTGESIAVAKAAVLSEQPDLFVRARTERKA